MLERLRITKLAGAALLALTLAAAARAEPALPPEVASLLARAKLPADALAAVVLETRPDRAPLLAWRADIPVNPASTLKLVTTYAALDRLGPDFRWQTRVYSDGPVRDGTLLGDLYLQGGGDPKLVSERLWLLLRQVQGLGIRRITGDIWLNRNLPFPAVDVANDVGARAIAKLIVDSGYTRPAILKGDDAHRSSKERLAGVMEVLDEAGITVDPKAVANGKFSRTDGYAAVMQMARSGLLKPGEGALYDGKGIDSIIALNDVMAIGAMTALRANGIEPGREIGVTGFGDIPYSADVFPPLTTVHLPLAEMGQAAVDSILSNRDDGEATGGTANRLIYVQSAPDVVLRGPLPRR